MDENNLENDVKESVKEDNNIEKIDTENNKTEKSIIVSNTKKDSKKNLIRNILILQAIMAIYTLSTVTAKFASGKEFMSFDFILFYGIEIVILGIYAILWQQIIKKFEISVAYANRAMSLLWAILWAIVFFHEEITIKNVIGVIIVIIGTIIVNRDDK